MGAAELAVPNPHEISSTLSGQMADGASLISLKWPRILSGSNSTSLKDRQFSTRIRTVASPITPGPRCSPVTSYRSVPSVM
jgi:hypothetical protein